MMINLPQSELTRLQLAEVRAEELASLGLVARGFLLLTNGLRNARAAREARQPWGRELARRYQVALDRFSARHAMKTDTPGPCLWRVTLPGPAEEPAVERPECRPTC